MKLLIIHELRQNFKSFLVWTSITVGMTIMMLSLFGAFGETLEHFEDVIRMYPEQFLNMFGLGPDGLNMADLYGWFGVEVYLFVTIMGGCYGAILGSSILSKEEDDKTIEFILSRPILRSHILLGKAIVVILYLMMLNLVYGFAIMILFMTLGELDVMVWVLLIIGPLILQIIFASIAFMISVFITKARLVMSISIGLVLGMYSLSLISEVSDNFEFLRYFTPFKYFNSYMIIVERTIYLEYIIISSVIIVATSFISYYVYCRKDITT